MLIGCYLVCQPHLLEYKQFSSLLTLLSVVNCYEVMVIAACVHILRRLPSSRESSTLIVVEVLFLLDATFTNNSCLAVNFSRGMLVLTVAMTLGFVKFYALESAAGPGRSYFGESRGILVASMVFTYSFQPVMAAHAPQAGALQSCMTYLVWLGYGALPLFIHKMDTPVAAVASSAEVRAVFQEKNLQRVVMVMALVVPLLHVAGQSWVHRAPFEWDFLVPMLVGLMLALPELFPDISKTYTRLATLALLGGCVLTSGADTGWRIHLDPLPAELSSTRLTLLFSAACFILGWLRSGRTSRLDLALAALTAMLALFGSHSGNMFEFLLAPKGLKIIIFIVLSVTWAFFDRNYWLHSALIIANLFLVLQCFSAGNESLQMPSELFYYIPIVAFLVMLPYRSVAEVWALVPYVTIFVCGCLRAGELNGVALLYAVIAGGAIAAGYLLYGRAAVYAVCAYLVIVLLRRWNGGATTGISWGWLAIVLAFALFVLGFYGTRSRLTSTAEGNRFDEMSDAFSSTLPP